MKLKEIKQMLEGLTDEQLEQEIKCYGESSNCKIKKMKIANENFYWDDEFLSAKSDLKKTDVDISECDLEIKEGDWYFLI